MREVSVVAAGDPRGGLIHRGLGIPAGTDADILALKLPDRNVEPRLQLTFTSMTSGSE